MSDDIQAAGFSGSGVFGPPEHGSHGVTTDAAVRSWENNYQEAAIYLEEGENNVKFHAHPKNKQHLPAYLIIHNKLFYALHFFAALVLLLLALCEEPAVPELKMQIGVHVSLELLTLVVIGLESLLKVRWIGVKTFVTHIRSMIKLVCLVVMVCEAIIVLSRQTNHYRVTRALRPIFIIDSHYCFGVRRFLRQILQSLPPILDMLLLLIFFMSIFSIIGFYLFSEDPNDPYFSSIATSFVSLFVLLTTANFPDVMMPSYHHNPWSAMFFIMNYYASRRSRKDLYLCFKSLDVSGSGELSVDEFYRVYEVTGLSWKQKQSKQVWFEHVSGWMHKCGKGINWLVTWRWFGYFIYGVILSNGFWLIADTFFIKSSSTSLISNEVGRWSAVTFVIIYCIEAVLKIIGLGPTKYFTSHWDLFDLVVTVTAAVGLLMELYSHSLYWLLVLRPLRLLRLFKLKMRYRDVLATLMIILPRMISVGIVILILYYFFAIIGMELFGQIELRDCCNDTVVADYYRTGNTSKLHYYENNFHNILTSGVTLFELTVVNNWFVIMEGYAYTASQWSRLYFMVFYLVTMVVMTIIVAFLLEAFLFRIQVRRKAGDVHAEELRQHIVIDQYLSCEELERIHNKNVSLQSLVHSAHSATRDVIPSSALHHAQHRLYEGRRVKTKMDLYISMYQDEVKRWLEMDAQEARFEELESVGSDLNTSSSGSTQSSSVDDLRPCRSRPL